MYVHNPGGGEGGVVTRSHLSRGGGREVLVTMVPCFQGGREGGVVTRSSCPGGREVLSILGGREVLCDQCPMSRGGREVFSPSWGEGGRC